MNFIACVKSRTPPNADIAVAHASNVVAHMGNIAHRVGNEIVILGFVALRGDNAGGFRGHEVILTVRERVRRDA